MSESGFDRTVRYVGRNLIKKVYIAGCGGMLGDAFHETFSDFDLRCSDINACDVWLSKLDFRDREGYTRDVCDFRPDVLLHVGAHTDLEFCEINKEDAWATNVVAVETAVGIANMLNIPIVYIGTAGIFDGEKEFYDDWDIPNPIGVYARTKYAGERHVVENAGRYLVCRAGWMMGGGPRKDKKFVGKIMKQLACSPSEISVVDDKFGAPTYTQDFTLNVRSLLKAEKWGLYNMACTGGASRLDVAREILHIVGLVGTVKLRGVESSAFQEQYFAPRPRCERLVNRKLEMVGLQMMRDWRFALADYLNNHYRGYLNTNVLSG